MASAMRGNLDPRPGIQHPAHFFFGHSQPSRQLRLTYPCPHQRATRSATRAFIEKVASRCDLAGAILFGSRARKSLRAAVENKITPQRAGLAQQKASCPLPSIPPTGGVHALSARRPEGGLTGTQLWTPPSGNKTRSDVDLSIAELVCAAANHICILAISVIHCSL